MTFRARDPVQAGYGRIQRFTAKRASAGTRVADPVGFDIHSPEQLGYVAEQLAGEVLLETELVTRADGSTTEIVDPASFHYSEDAARPSLFTSESDGRGLFNAVYEGLVTGSRSGGAVGIIALILLTGGAFGIVSATGSIDRALRLAISNDSADVRLLLAGLFFLFSLGGAVFGMGEEIIPFVLMLVPVMTRLGYDRVTVVLVTLAATQVGFATSWMNPFSIAIAQGIADLPLLSGMPLRIFMWSVFTLFGMAFTVRYAGRIRVTPEASAAAPASERPALSTGDWLVLAALALVVFASWKPWRTLLGAYLFGGITVLQLNLQAAGVAIPVEYLAMSPYLITIIVLVIGSREAIRKRLGAPAALGIPFVREER